MNSPDRIQSINLGSKSKFDKKIDDLIHRNPLLSGEINNSFGYSQQTTTGNIPFQSNSYTLTTALSL